MFLESHWSPSVSPSPLRALDVTKFHGCCEMSSRASWALTYFHGQDNKLGSGRGTSNRSEKENEKIKLHNIIGFIKIRSQS